MSNDGFQVVVVVVLVIVGAMIGRVTAKADIRSECDAFGKAMIYAKVYTCIKQ